MATLLITLFFTFSVNASESLYGDCVARCETVVHKAHLNVEANNYSQFCREKYSGRVAKKNERLVCIARSVFNLGEVGIDSSQCNDVSTVRSWLSVCGELAKQENRCLGGGQVTIENWSCQSGSSTTQFINYIR